MSYWCEVHCDTPLNMTPTDPSRRCDVETGCIPGTKLKSVRRALDGARALAHERGYRYDRLYGWQCPNCQRGRTYAGAGDVSEQVFAAGIREAIAAGDKAKASWLKRIWRGFMEDRNVF